MSMDQNGWCDTPEWEREAQLPDEVLLANAQVVVSARSEPQS